MFTAFVNYAQQDANLLNTCTTPSISILPMPDQEALSVFLRYIVHNG
jgi:hypothetical protein